MNNNLKTGFIDRDNQDNYLRPQYHFTSPKGWINDPNGLIYYKGWYHLFYQFNPDHLEWAEMHWGHAVSENLLEWHDLPIALYPDKEYDHDPAGGCFSGSAFEYDGKMFLIYTGSVIKDGTLRQTQNIAFSEDGVHFQKYDGNPVISEPIQGANANFRDPKVFKHEDHLYLVAGGTFGNNDRDGEGCVYLYQSDDPYHWKYVSTLIGPNRKIGTMLECPDLFPLGDKWVLTTSPIYNKNFNECLYFVGTLDFSTGKYNIENEGRLDLGGYYYAPQSFLGAEGQRLQIAWLNTWQWMPWFNDWGPTQEENWRGVMSLPHELSLDENNCLVSAPISISAIEKEDQYFDNVDLTSEPFYLSPSNPYSYELSFIADKKTCPSRTIEIGIFGAGSTHTKISLDLLTNKVLLDLRDSRDVLGSGISCADIPDGDVIKIRLQVDHCAAEICFNEKTHLCFNIYPKAEQKELWLRTPYQKARIEKLTLYSSKE